MEEIEYLEEYEDLVLPAINSAADAAATAKSSKSVNVDNDGSSSSLDQDIFNCLFDDNSDDDNDEQQQSLKEQEGYNQKIPTLHSEDDSNDLLNDLGKQVARELSLKNTTLLPIGEKDSTKAAPRQKTLFSKNSVSKTELIPGVSSLASAKIKTVATVRPTVQQKTLHQKFNIAKQKARHSNPTASNAGSKTETKISPSTSFLARRHLAANTSTFTATSSSGTNKLNTSHRPKPSFNKQRPATIVKPEKIVTKDPAEDPLNLDDLSSAESANYSVSDISGETYNSISDFDDDDDYDFTSHIDALDDDDDESSNSQVIDISNDSSESRSHFEDLRGSTPSPVVSEDRDLAINKRRFLPKFMANHEIIKSLLTKGDKPKLLQLINEHDATDNPLNKDQELGNLELSSTTETTNKDSQTATLITKPPVLSAKTNKDNNKLKTTVSLESSILNANDREEKSKVLSVGQSSESTLEAAHLKDFNKNNRKSYTNVVNTSRHDSLPNQEVGAEMEISNEEIIEDALNRGDENMKDSKTLDKITVPQTSKVEKKYDSPKVEEKCFDTEEVRKKVQTPISKEVNNDKESTESASERPRKKRFRNLVTPELKDIKDDKSVEVISHTKFDKPFIQSDNAGTTNNQEGNSNVSKQSTEVPIDSKTKMKVEENVTIIKLTSKESFKSPTKGVDKSNKSNANRDRSCDSSTDSSRETSNKPIKDVPRGVIMNPFVQRTSKNTFSTDGRAKMSRDSSRDNSRESSVESSRGSSKDRYKDNAKTSKLIRSEVSTIPQHEHKQKDLKETVKKHDAAENPVSVDTEKRETPKRSNDIGDKKSENKMKTNNDNDINKNKSVVIKDIKSDNKNTSHLADTIKKETPKKSADTVESKSNTKMSPNVGNINKSIGHLTKNITGSAVKRKGTTENIHVNKPLKSNDSISGPAKVNEVKLSSSPLKFNKSDIPVKSDIVSITPQKADNADRKDNKCKEISKVDIGKVQKEAHKSSMQIAKMSKDLTDSSKVCEQKHLKETSHLSQSSPVKSLGSHKKSLTTKKETSTGNVSKELIKATTQKIIIKSFEKSSDAINKPAVTKAKIENKPSTMPSKTTITTGTTDSKVVESEKKNVKESKTAIGNKETPKSVNKHHDETPLNSQDYRHIKTKQKCAITFTDKVLNSPTIVHKSKAEGKSVISKTLVNTSEIIESETVKTECEVKKQQNKNVTMVINPQKDVVTKPNEEKKHIRTVSTSLGKKSSKDSSIKSVTSPFDVSKEEECKASGKREVSKHVIEQVDDDGNSREQRKSSIDKSTDDIGPKAICNTKKSCSEQTTKSKKNEKLDSKLEKCENKKAHIEVKDVIPLEGAKQKCISKEIKSRDNIDAAKSKDDNSTSIIDSNESIAEKPRELVSTSRDIENNLKSKELKEITVKDSKLSKDKDAENTFSVEQDSMTSKPLAQATIGLIETQELNDNQKGTNKNDESTITTSEAEVGEKEEIDVQQDEIDRNTTEPCLKSITIASNIKDATNDSDKTDRTVDTLTEAGACKNPKIKQGIKDVCRSEEESATAEFTTPDVILKGKKDERKEISNTTSIDKEIRNESPPAETNASFQKNLNTIPADASTLLTTEEIDLHTVTKSTALSIRKTRRSKPDEILPQEETIVSCNPLKPDEVKDLAVKSTHVEARQSKNTKSEESDLSNKAHSEISKTTPEESKEPLLETVKLCEFEQTETDRTSDDNIATSLKNVMRKTRSTANTDDDAKYESNSLDGSCFNLSSNTKTNENTVKNPQRNVRKNRNTPSKCEELDEDSKSQETVVSKCRNVSPDELNQLDALVNNDDTDANKSLQKKNRKTRWTLDPKADNTSKTISDVYDTSKKSKNIVEALTLNANEVESPQSKSNLIEESDIIKLGLDSDKIEKNNVKDTSEITVSCLQNEKQKTKDDELKSTDSALNLPAQIIPKACIDEPTSNRNKPNFDDNVNKTQSEHIAVLESASAIEEDSKNGDTLKLGYLSRDAEFSGKTTRDLLMHEDKSTNVPTETDIQFPIDKNLTTNVVKVGGFPISATSNKSLETLTLPKCLNEIETDSPKEATLYSPERARTLRKRGSESPFCENRDGGNKTLFKTPIVGLESCKAEAQLAPEVKKRRRLRSPAAEKESQAPLTKKSKIDIRRVRKRNIDVRILDASESSSDLQLPDTSKQTPILSPRRSLQKQSGHMNELIFDSTAQGNDAKANITQPCKLEQTSSRPLSDDRRSAEKKNQLTCNVYDEQTSSSCTNSQCSTEKSNIAFDKVLALSGEKEENQFPGMSKTYRSNEIFNPENRASCSILSFAEWLRGNNRNDATQKQNESVANTTIIQTELSDTSKPIGVQEFIPRPPTDILPEKITNLHSHVSRQVSPKRSRKVKSVPISKGADSKESEKEKNFYRATENVPEQTTKPITKKILQSPQKTDTSPKRGRKVKTISIVQTEKDKETTGDVATEKIELQSHIDAPHKVKDNKLQICTKSEQKISSTQEKSSENVKALEQGTPPLTGESKGPETRTDIADNDNLSLTIGSPSLKSRKRRPKIRSGRVLVAGNISKDQQQQTKSMHPTRQDKKPNKRTEIDILIESMSKEMKDAGIKDLLNTSSNVKRQRAVVKRSNPGESTYLNPTNLGVNETVTKEKIIKDTGSIIDSVRSSNTTEEVAKKSPTRRSTSKKLNITKESDKNVVNTEPLRPMEMEKALIDEVEIRNMNTSLLEPLKYDLMKQTRPPSKLALKASPSFESCGFKTPKPLATINRIKSAENVSQLYRGKANTNMNDSVRRVPSLKCRMLKVKLNRRVVKKYLQNVVQMDTSLLNRTQHNRIKNPIIATSTTISVITPEEAELSMQAAGISKPVVSTPHEVKEISEVLPTINKGSGEAYKKQQSLMTQKTIHTPALTDKSSRSLYTEPCNMARDNNRSAEEILADSVMEPMAQIELKNEFLDENPNSLCDATLPDTPTLIARSHTITQAAASALSNTIMPTDIRLLTNDPMSTRAYVPSFGVTPTLVDAKGARMYTFLHPAKYSRNHGNVLLDYCCPNLDGPMPAIDPTRIHAQVQTPVIELPSCIVLTTKVVTRAELESKSSTIPAVIRKKAEKLRSNIHENVGDTNEKHINVVPLQSPRPLHIHPPKVTNSSPLQHPQAPNSVVPVMEPSQFSNTPNFSPAINALAKYLPSTTTITAKIRSPHSQPHLTLPVSNTNQHASSVVSVVSKVSPILSETQTNLLRSNLRRVDVIFKSLVQPFEKLNFTERHRIIDNLVSSGKFLPKDLERTIVLMEEYFKQINVIQKNQITGASSSSNVTPMTTQLTNLAPLRMPALQPAPNLSPSTFKSDADQNVEQVQNTAVRKVQSSVKQHNPTVNTTTLKQRQVPIYDTERNIIGYQLQVITPATNMPPYTKSTLSTTSGGITTSSLGASNNNPRKSVKRPAQDSPRVFYTSQPMQTSTPKTKLNSMQYSTKSITANKNAQTIGNSQNGSIVTTVRSGGPTSAGTETITTTTMATVKRVTRSRAAGSKIIIVSKSNSNEETILPDVNHQTEIKHEKDVEDFIG